MTAPRDDRGRSQGPLEGELRAELERLEQRGLRRSTERVSVGIDFTSNDYLGLARDPVVIAAARAALENEGAGSRAARLLSERLPSHELAERRVAEWVGSEAGLLFPTGYQANLGVVGALAGAGDLIVSDALNHASLIDAARLSRATTKVHRHLDLEHVEQLLVAGRGARRRLVLTEGVFSMDGDLAPLAELHELCERHNAYLVVDEAHSAGLLGPRGAGAFAEAMERGCGSERVAARIVTGGKALGSAAAVVACGSALREVLVQRARTFVFTTASPPAVAAAFAAAVERAAAAEDLRERCLAMARDLAHRLGLRVPAAAIVPLVVGHEGSALALAEVAERGGFAVRAVRPPTVPDGTSRLRLVAHAHNSVDETRELSELLARGWKDLAGVQSSPGPPPPPPPPPPLLSSTSTLQAPPSPAGPSRASSTTRSHSTSRSRPRPRPRPQSPARPDRPHPASSSPEPTPTSARQWSVPWHFTPPPGRGRPAIGNRCRPASIRRAPKRTPDRAEDRARRTRTTPSR
ncbi:8-amino-7-oxononanoate synthase 2 [Planctomycetes bacterium Pla133]|uniref:8-amino-7-oxononanoate synthase 2 n=1 Tax=Engelhardtia mirabilis TaxID=2528011 RepID=A0A518BSH2_9BACT|nr:8-amino-7-oxononanoate synthase 2 [Planctomycetes bacterium Pla133]